MRRVRPSRPASACSFSTLRLNLVLTRGIPPDFHGGVHLFIPPYAIGSVPSLSGHATTYLWRSLPRVHRHRASSPQCTIVPVTGAAFAGHHGPINVRLSFPSSTWHEVGMLKVSDDCWRFFGVGGNLSYYNIHLVYTTPLLVKSPQKAYTYGI